MTSFTASVLAEFEKNIDIDLEYGLAEIKAILSTAYKTMKEANAPAKKLSANGEVKAKKERVKRDRDADGNIIKKRAPSAYNIFVGEKSKEIRAENPDMNSKEVFKAAIALWNKSKAEKASDDSNAEEAVEAEIVEAEAVEAEVDAAEEPVDAEIVEPVKKTKPAKKGRKPKDNSSNDSE